MATKKTNSRKKDKAAKPRAKTGSQRSKKPATRKIAPPKAAKRKSPAKSERPLYSISRLAKLLGYAESTIREHIKENGGPVEEKTGRGRAAKLDPAKWLRFFLDRQAGTASPLLDARTEKIQIEEASKRLEHKLRAGQVVEVETLIEFSLDNALDQHSPLWDSGQVSGGGRCSKSQFFERGQECWNTRKNQVISGRDYKRP